MICAIKIQVATNGIRMKSDKYNVNRRSWYDSQVDVFHVILENLFHKQNAILNREVLLARRLAIHVIQRTNVVRRFCQHWVCDNVK